MPTNYAQQLRPGLSIVCLLAMTVGATGQENAGQQSVAANVQNGVEVAATPPAAGSTAPVEQDAEAAQDPAQQEKAQQDPKDVPTPKPTEPVAAAKTDLPTAAKPVVKPINLLEADFTSTWKLFASEEGVKVQDVWKVNTVEGVRILVCTGKPKGYLRTIKAHENYTLQFDFRYPVDANGNSGVLLHMDGKEKIWPDGIQVQLHRPTAGSILPCGNRKTRFKVGASLPLNLNSWNKCRIEVMEDKIEVAINGLAVGPLRFCDPAKGHIALQAEGSEVHFRNVFLQLSAPPTVAKPPVEVATGEPNKAEPPKKAGAEAVVPTEIQKGTDGSAEKKVDDKTETSGDGIAHGPADAAADKNAAG